MGGEGDQQEEEEGDLVTGLIEQWLKRMIKGTLSSPKRSQKSKVKPEVKAETSSLRTPVVKGKPKKLTRNKLQESLPFHKNIDLRGGV